MYDVTLCLSAELAGAITEDTSCTKRGMAQLRALGATADWAPAFEKADCEALGTECVCFQAAAPQVGPSLELGEGGAGKAAPRPPQRCAGLPHARAHQPGSDACRGATGGGAEGLSTRRATTAASLPWPPHGAPDGRGGIGRTRCYPRVNAVLRGACSQFHLPTWQAGPPQHVVIHGCLSRCSWRVLGAASGSSRGPGSGSRSRWLLQSCGARWL